MYRVLVFIGFIVMACSVVMVIAALGDIVSPPAADATPVGVLWGLVVFFGLFALGGGYVSYSFWSKARRDRRQRRERELLRLIAAHHGKITVLEVAAETELNLQEAEHALRELSYSGRGELRLTEDGSLVYYFGGFIDEAQKNSAKSVLER